MGAPLPGVAAWAAVASAVAFCTALGYALYGQRDQSSAGDRAVFLGVAILREQFHADEFIGMAMIGFGLHMIDGRLLTLLNP
jgi:uncharacterized membrane protein